MHTTAKSPLLGDRIGPRAWIALGLAAALTGACAGYTPRPYTTERDKTYKGAGIGAAVGAIATYAKGKHEADEVLAGAAIGAVLGGGVGAYMDHQEEQLARIPGTTVERLDGRTLMVRFDSDLLFSVDSAALSYDARDQIDSVAGVLQEFRKTAVVVHGHTDATGSEAHNQALSERRAKSVQTVLIRQGIDPNRVSAIGSGEALPVASNDTDWGRSQNRRVEILLRANAT